MTGQLNSGKPEKHALVCYVNQQYHEMLSFHAIGLCKRFKRDISYADDLVQDLYFQIMTRQEVFAINYAKWGVPYFLRSLTNRMIDLDRKRNSLARLGDFYAGQFPKTANIYYLCVEEHLTNFLELMEGFLKERDFEVMKAYLFGYKYSEISEQFGISENSVGVIIHRAKKIIRHHLDNR